MAGSFRTTSGEYSLPSVHLPGYDTEVEMQAVVVAPEGATGSRPPALFLHGRQATCFKGDDATLERPCPAGHEPVPSYRGYLHDQQGEYYVDGTRGVSRAKALHSAVYMTGANHNYFNGEWTPGKAMAPADDDFSYDGDEHDPLCSPDTATWLTAEQQQKAAGRAVVAFHAFQSAPRSRGLCREEGNAWRLGL